FTFQVRDDGGITGGGVNLDQSANTLTINVKIGRASRRDSDDTVTTAEDTAYNFGALDFGFTDPNDSPVNALDAVKITTLPALGSLTDNNVAVTLGQIIPVADSTGGKLVFTPVSNAHVSPYAPFTFQVRDDGGITGGGVNLDQSANTLTINV